MRTKVCCSDVGVHVPAARRELVHGVHREVQGGAHAEVLPWQGLGIRKQVDAIDFPAVEQALPVQPHLLQWCSWRSIRRCPTRSHRSLGSTSCGGRFAQAVDHGQPGQVRRRQELRDR